MEDLLRAAGPRPQPTRAALAALAAGWTTLAELVRSTALPRRAVEALLQAVDGDLEREGDAVRLAPAARDSYAEQARTRTTPLADPLAAATAERPELLAKVRGWVDGVPVALQALDHVQATAETVVRRALWLSANYELEQSRLLFLGDHDLTSLAVHALHPGARITVVDVDDRLLAYVDEHSGDSLRVLHTDLRFGLPRAASGQADLVFTDPPYTPEGMGLFAGRGVECLADPRSGRLVLAYGFSALHPTLGAQVQRALLDRGLVFEAVLPAFHRYLGAQAVGSAADLYVCRPTSAKQRAGGKGRNRQGQTGIYTHGPQSVEAAAAEEHLRTALLEIAARDGAEVSGDVRGPDWTVPQAGDEPAVLAMDLTGDPGPWLLRALVGRNAGRLAVLVPNHHPDLADEAGQRALTGLVSAKYRLRLLRSTPDGKHAVVLADRAADGDPAQRELLSKAHGKLANVLRDALIARHDLTQNEARERVRTLAQGGGLREHELELRLIDLPRHRIAAVLAALG